MNRDETLQRIEHATDEEEVMRALRDFITDPANGHDPRLATMLGTASDVPGIALELTRFRLAARTAEIATDDLEPVFARASVKIAELHDHTGGWKAFKIRSSSDKKTNGAK
jgi:hypothetical protein